jgi:hypothetical protein
MSEKIQVGVKCTCTLSGGRKKIFENEEKSKLQLGHCTRVITISGSLCWKALAEQLKGPKFGLTSDRLVA